MDYIESEFRNLNGNGGTWALNSIALDSQYGRENNEITRPDAVVGDVCNTGEAVRL